jgi:hypothetical protein
MELAMPALAPAPLGSLSAELSEQLRATSAAAAMRKGFAIMGSRRGARSAAAALS